MNVKREREAHTHIKGKRKREREIDRDTKLRDGARERNLLFGKTKNLSRVHNVFPFRFTYVERIEYNCVEL